MEILQLRYFCDAAETQNFSRTAEKYGVPVSNISQTIKRLEKELETELFVHMSNRITLNECGKLFYKKVSDALILLEEGKKILFDNKNKIMGEIKILVLTNRRIATKAIEIFKQRYPEVTFVIKHNYDTQADFDLIICDEYFIDASFESEILVVDDILLAIHKDSHLAKKKIVKVSDLKDERFITMPHGSSMYEITNRLCSGFVPNIVIQSDDPFYIRKYVAMGLGIAFFPSMSWQGQFSDDVIFKRIGNITRNTVVARKKDRYLSNHTKLFIEILKRAAKES